MEIKELKPSRFPERLREIPSPPEKLWISGELPPEDFFYLAIVGTRKYSSYGEEVCERIISGLKNYNFVIISGLAIGIDSIAHKLALENNLKTIAVPGSGLDFSVLHPHSNRPLAKKIVESGGCLISEFPPKMPAGLHTFPQRNRIIAGLSKAVLIIEAPEKSGALITARFALDFNRDVLAVPGSIFNENSKGTNQLIKMGAVPVTSSEDILEIFNINTSSDSNAKLFALSPLEEKILLALDCPMSKDDLIRKLDMSAYEINPALTMMQINGLIKERDGEIYKII